MSQFNIIGFWNLRRLLCRKYFVIALVAVLGVLFAFYVPKIVSNEDDSKSEFSFDICDYTADKFDDVETLFFKDFPEGSDAKILLDALKASDFKNYDYARPSRDWLQGKDVIVSAYTYEHKCPVINGNQDIWWVIFFVDDANKIVARQLRLLFEDQNFLGRNIPFRFKHFTEKSGQRALWDMTGEGTPFEEVEKIMLDIGAKNFSSKRSLTFQYRYKPSMEENIMIRAYGMTNSWIMLWTFDANNNLVALDIK